MGRPTNPNGEAPLTRGDPCLALAPRWRASPDATTWW